MSLDLTLSPSGECNIYASVMKMELSRLWQSYMYTYNPVSTNTTPHHRCQPATYYATGKQWFLLSIFTKCKCVLLLLKYAQ